MGTCPFCKHQWTYKEKVLGYSLKPRTRIKCPECKSYIEPSTLTIIYDYIAILLVAAFVFVLIPIWHLSINVSITLSALLLIAYLFLFLPFTLRFKKYDYNIKKR
ncbi:TIGR04104 family putative zinc finger protein [Corticicoccus populi]|uniref:TIGR04104 family putative zinc finger protein n=1 Tax=Corticicoccus populi TaxID=1812821 RepID=A0ABW5X1B3_9STAP